MRGAQKLFVLEPVGFVPLMHGTLSPQRQDSSCRFNSLSWQEYHVLVTPRFLQLSAGGTQQLSLLRAIVLWSNYNLWT